LIGGIGDDEFDGYIDEVAIYSKALSASEIQELYYAKKAKFVDWVDGKISKSLEFDGMDDYVKIIDSDSLHISEYTFETWIYPRSYGEGGYGRLHASYSDSNAIYMDSPNQGLTIRVYNGTNTFHYRVPYSWVWNEWYHVVAVVHNNLTVEVFINSELQSGTWGEGLISGTLVFQGDIYIGNLQGGYRAFNGTIDEVRIYNVALTEEEIKANYELGLKRLLSSGSTSLIDHKEKIYLVVSNPSGKSYFDNIKVKTIEKKMKLIVPFEKIDFTGSLRIGKGNFKVSVENKGLNEENEPKIEIKII
jgi:hypothetical protein